MIEVARELIGQPVEVVWTAWQYGQRLRDVSPCPLFANEVIAKRLGLSP